MLKMHKILSHIAYTKEGFQAKNGEDQEKDRDDLQNSKEIGRESSVLEIQEVRKRVEK